VPEGWWKVVYEKDGYLPAQSRALRVLPPHTDVDVALVRAGLPDVSSIRSLGGGVVRIAFNRPMRVRSLVGAVSVLADGEPVTVSVDPVAAEPDDSGVRLASAFDVTGSPALEGGQVFRVTVDRSVQDYADRPMAADASAE